MKNEVILSYNSQYNVENYLQDFLNVLVDNDIITEEEAEEIKEVEDLKEIGIEEEELDEYISRIKKVEKDIFIEKSKKYFKKWWYVIFDDDDEIVWARSFYNIQEVLEYFIDRNTNNFELNIFRNWDIEYSEHSWNAMFWKTNKIRYIENFQDKEEMIKIIREHMRDEIDYRDLIEELDNTYEANNLEDLSENELQTLMYDTLYTRYY